MSRIVLIDRRFQLRLAAEFVGLQVALSLLFGAGLYLFMNSELQANLASAHARYHSMAQMLMPIVITLSAFNILVATVLVTIYVVHMSHRIARPLLRIRAVLEELARHCFLDHTDIHPGDQLWEVDRSLTNAVATVKGDVEALRQIAGGLRRAQTAGDGAEVLKQIERLEQAVGAWTSFAKD